MTPRAAISLIQPKSHKSPVKAILQLHCQVRPGANKAREGVVAITDDSIQLCVSAPAQDGKANKAVLEVLSHALGVPKSDLQIVHGLKSKEKTISLACMPSWQGQTGDNTGIVEAVREKLLSNTTTATT
ncbi:YggU-like protein [Xylariaceae sp. FL1272]|nr:YggU-like protein [Xylariaceae sp. FL1272]